MTAEAAVIARGLGKRYGATRALDDVSLDIRRGEVFCLLGPNGSGKTTFLRILAGYLAPSEGSISLSGHDVVRESLAARACLGYVPEAVPIYSHMRVREFLRFMGRLRGLQGPALEDAIARVVERLALQAVLDRPSRALSRGYRQRVAIAQALLHDPEVVILDEPTNGLDPRQIVEARLLIRALAGRHTVIMSSHILGEVEKTADRVAVFLGGRLRGVRETGGPEGLEPWFMSLA